MKPFRFGIVGEYQSGKSLLVNCLLRRSVATVGNGNETTHTVVNYRYAEKEYIDYITDKGEQCTISIERMNELDTRTDISVIDVYLTNEFLKSYILTDMPGFGANEKDNNVARETLPKLDFAILIAWNEKALGAFTEIRELRTHNVPYYFILNCTKKEKPRWRYDNIENINIAKKDLSLLDFYKPSYYPLEEDGVNIVNLMWYWYSICSNDDKLINREEYQKPFMDYRININVKKDVGEASNFRLINRLFDMDNRAFWELRRSFKEEIENLKQEICPIGTIQAFAFNGIPKGWLPCDGRQLQISEYPDLFRVIRFTFGGDKKESFFLPDLRGRFIRGWDSKGKKDEKRIFGSKQEDALQNHAHKSVFSENLTSENGSHSHTIKYENESYGYGGMFSSTYYMRHITDLKSYDHEMSACLSSGSHTHSLPQIKTEEVKDLKKTKVRFSNETRPKNIALLYCIKYI